jgi:hypothetical protein
VTGNQGDEAVAETRIYRAASGTPDSVTPRPGIDDLPGGGVSFWSSVAHLSPGKYIEVDPGRLRDLIARFDGNPPGHVTVAPPSSALLADWAATRGTGVIHPLTQELLGAITRLGRK